MWLPARWTDKQGHDFHIKDGCLARQYVASIESGAEDTDIGFFDKMIFRREWMEDHGEGNPANYDWLKERCDEFVALTEEGKFTPGIIEKRVYQKTMFYILTKFKQDSAYREIAGGWLTLLALNPAAWTSLQTKDDRVKYLLRQQKWLDANYHRARTKPWIMAVISDVIKRYNKSEFVESAVNWFYDQMAAHAKDWVIDRCYDPKTWYPIGRGYVENQLKGGMG